MVFGFLHRKKEEMPSFGPMEETQPLPPPPAQQFQTPMFQTPSTVVVEQQQQKQDTDIIRLLDDIKHKVEMLDQKIEKIEQTLDFMQRYVYANR
jgi:hypothetical protein